MKSIDIRRYKHCAVAIFIAVVALVATPSAQAYIYAGGDWGGKDLSLLTGDSLSGTFSNVGQFYIPTGALVSGGAANLVVNAGTARIDGSLSGVPVTGYNLEIYSLTNIILNGSISSWKNILLSANFITVNGNVSVLDAQVVVNPIHSPIILDRGTISIVSTPIPAAAWLFGSGLLGLAGITRQRVHPGR